MDGEFFTGAALATTLTKLALRYVAQTPDKRKQNVRVCLGVLLDLCSRIFQSTYRIFLLDSLIGTSEHFCMFSRIFSCYPICLLSRVAVVSVYFYLLISPDLCGEHFASVDDC